MLLLAKAVVVAIAGHEWLWPEPKHRGAAGLIYLYAAISSSLIALFVLRRSAIALIDGERLETPVLTALLSRERSFFSPVRGLLGSGQQNAVLPPAVQLGRSTA